MDFFIGLGYFGLFLGAFLAGSIVPFSSEVLLGAALTDAIDAGWCLVVVSLGNTLGGMTCYYLGRLGKIEWIHKWIGVSDEKLNKWQQRVQRRGSVMALLSWLPYAGEAISIVLGLLRCPWGSVCLYMAIGKFARYWVMLLAIQGVFSAVSPILGNL